MTSAQTSEKTPRKPLRLWPGVVAVIVQLLFWFGLPVVAPDAPLISVIGGVISGLAVVVWWLFFSRAPWSERVGAFVLMIVAVIATRPILDQSIQAGIGGMMFYIYVVPGLTLALVVVAVAGRRLSAGRRRAAMVAGILLACGVWTLLRTESFRVGSAQMAWRWTATSEERLLARAGSEPVPVPSAPAAATTTEKPLPAPATNEPATPPGAAAVGTAATPAGAAAVGTATGPAMSERGFGRVEGPAMSERGFGRVEGPAMSERGVGRVEGPAMSERGRGRVEWPGFRGPGRDGIVRGVRIETDWSASPPIEMWRRPIGPGLSSFAVQGDLLYTQEQRGDEEIVACYNVSTGKPVWRHADATRFWESYGGAGPRATPTLSNGRVYTFGATGILNALDAGNGAVVWSRNAASDADKQVPTWGFASSPLVVGDVIVVAASGKLVAYDMATGTPRWFGPARPGSYSSPHRSTVDGIEQILLMTAAGATSVAPADGTLLWEHVWRGDAAIVQPALTADGDILINAKSGPAGIGTRRLAVTHGAGGWSVHERWTSNGLKPFFNDFVVHMGHAFGFDGSILACIDLADGKRKWKGGRYGNGQLVLLSDADLLLVLSEEGELALVKATPDQFTELARFKAIEGKTWNHPVLAGDVLLVRNGEEMAAFRLSLAGR